MRVALSPLAALVVGLVAACSKNAASSDAGADASPAASDAPIAPTPSAPLGDAAAGPSAPGGEAERGELARLESDPTLLPHLPALQKHFGAAKGPFLVQRLPLSGERRLLLLSSRDESDPFVLAVRGDALLWSKERPTAGMIPPAVSLAIVAHPQGGATLFAYDTPTKSIAARVWSDDGAPFADFQVLKLDACDELSAAHWPGHGMLVVCAWQGGARAQLLTEDGIMAWRRDGADVGGSWRAPAPMTIAFDTPDTVVLVQHADVAGGPAGDHVVATRYDARGRPMWASPVDLGAVPQTPRARERLAASVVAGAGGVLRVEISRGAFVDVDASGKRNRPKHGFEP